MPAAVPDSLVGLGWSFLERAGHLGMEHLSEGLKAKRRGTSAPAAHQPQGPPRFVTLDDLKQRAGFVTMDGLKRLDALPGLDAVAAPVRLSTSAPTSGSSQPSYAEEFQMDDSSPIACWPCTRRHVNTCLVAVEAGATATAAEERKAAAATIMGEVAVWRRYDVTQDKLAATPADRRAAVEAAIPGMSAAVSDLPAGPANLPLAWAAAVEAARFAGSNAGHPSPLEQQERDLRMEDVQGWVGYLDTLTLPPAARPHLAALRAARHKINREGNTPEAVCAMRDALRTAAVALTPDPGPGAIRKAHGHLKQARGAFMRQARAAMRAKDEQPNKPARARAYLDIDTRIPEALARAYLIETGGSASALGATPETRVAFEHLAAFCEARGVPVRDEPLPPDMEDGEVVGVILGAYVPDADTIYLGPQAVVEAPKDLYTLCEEAAHSLLVGKRERCNVWHSGQNVAYDDMPEEREAKLAALIALHEARMPLETDAGRRINPKRATANLEAAERHVGAKILARAKWAGGIMAQAMGGDVAGAVRTAGPGCPK